jgi:ribosomal protein S30
VLKIPGSHGSMTKAGKVRQQTPNVESKGVNASKKMIPRKRYHRLYKKRVVKERYGGQPNSIGAKRALYST